MARMMSLKILRVWLALTRPLLPVAVMMSAVTTVAMGCERQAPTGRVEPSKVQTNVGKTVSLELILRPAHEGVNREIWRVQPPELGEIYYDQATIKHRNAVFRAKKSGTGKITVQGFLKEKAPHPLAEVSVTIDP